MKLLYRKKSIKPTVINFGVIYNSYVLSDARGILPPGFHVPSKTEFMNLCIQLDADASEYVNDAGGQMKTAGFTFWSAPNTGGTNSSGFNGKGGGQRNDTTGAFSGFLGSVRFWQSTIAAGQRGVSQLDSGLARFVTAFAGGLNNVYKTGNYLRLIKDDGNDPGMVADFDGNIYTCVKIGSQVWMKENYIVEHFNNGESIPNITGNAAWAALTTAGMCYYNNDISNR